MRVKLQLVLCSDGGRDETVTDIVSWNQVWCTAPACGERPVPDNSQWQVNPRYDSG